MKDLHSSSTVVIHGDDDGDERTRNYFNVAIYKLQYRMTPEPNEKPKK